MDDEDLRRLPLAQGVRVRIGVRVRARVRVRVRVGVRVTIAGVRGNPSLDPNPSIRP